MVRDDFWMATRRFLEELDVRINEGFNTAAVDLFDLRHAAKVLTAFGRAYGALPADSDERRSSSSPGHVATALTPGPSPGGRGESGVSGGGRGEIEMAGGGTGESRCARGLSAEQQAFVEQAIRWLAQDGRVVCVRLVLFAEMFKGRPWTPAALRDVGGVEGVGVAFLETVFGPSASPERRLHANAACGILGALLPEAGSEIKGAMRTRAELLEVSGYAAKRRDFDDVMRALDGELRLITPCDPHASSFPSSAWERSVRSSASRGTSGSSPADPGAIERGRASDAASSQVEPGNEGRRRASAGAVPSGAGEREPDAACYQLTHDFLVAPIREWLTRGQKETRRGRAELRLKECLAIWSAKPDNRHLPSIWEYASIRLFTKRNRWNEPQRTMMETAGRVLRQRGLLAGLALAATAAAGWFIQDQLMDQQDRKYARATVQGFLAADTGDIERLIPELRSRARRISPILRDVAANETSTPKERLHASLALIADEPAHAEYLFERLLTAGAEETPVIVRALEPHQEGLKARLWQSVAGGSSSERLRAAVALAAYDPKNPQWREAASDVLTALVSVPALEGRSWIDGLRPVGRSFAAALIFGYQNLYRGSKEEAKRWLLATAAADYLRDNPQTLCDFVLDVRGDCDFLPLLAALRPRAEQCSRRFRGLLSESLPAGATAEQRDLLVRRHANAAVALLELGDREAVLPLLAHSRDPSLRSMIIDRIVRLGADHRPLVRLLADARDAGLRQALVVTLAELDPNGLSRQERQDVLAAAERLFPDPDAGVHSAALLLLRRWQAESVLADLVAATQQAPDKPPAGQTWLIDSQGQTFVVVAGPVEFMMHEGDEPGYPLHAAPERALIAHEFAIAACEVTVEQFQRFRKDHWYQTGYAPQSECPMTNVSWYDAAAYCNWLSEQDGLPAEEWCYAPNAEGRFADGMTIPAGSLRRTGYRLPTEVEWEFACRAGTATSYSFGEPLELLAAHGWFFAGMGPTRPVGRLRPNALGMFDVHGNVWEWCHPGSHQNVDLPMSITYHTVGLLLRGGSFLQGAGLLRSAFRQGARADMNLYDHGFRVARTLRRAPDGASPVTATGP